MRYTAQLIKRTEKTLYYDNGKLVESPSAEFKLLTSIFGENKTMMVEEIITRWNVKTKSEANQKFWDFIEESQVDSRDYLLVFAD